MNFSQAMMHMLSGHAVRRPHWLGYWRYHDNDVVLHSKDGSVTPLREALNHQTLMNMAADDWVLVKDSAVTIVATMSFSDALRGLKTGIRMRRKVWAPHVWICLVNTGLYDVACKTVPFNPEPNAINPVLAPWFAMCDEHGQFTPWTPNHADLNGIDYIIVPE